MLTLPTVLALHGTPHLIISCCLCCLLLALSCAWHWSDGVKPAHDAIPAQLLHIQCQLAAQQL
jgi:hypothetical protein